MTQLEHGPFPARTPNRYTFKATHKAERKKMGGRILGKFKEKEVRVCHPPQKMLNSKINRIVMIRGKIHTT